MDSTQFIPRLSEDQRAGDESEPILDALTYRTDPVARNRFLEELLHRYDRRIRAILGRNKHPLCELDDCRQAFLIAANTALQIARDVDDGRGQNSVEGWCAWRGLNAVRDSVRNNNVGRSNRKNARQSGDRRTSSMETHFGLLSNESTAGEVVARAQREAIMSKLTGKHKQVLVALLDGHPDLKCACGNRRHNASADIARSLGISERSYFKYIAVVRKVAVQVLEAA